MSTFKQYKVITVEEGGCGTILLGASSIPLRKLEEMLNKEAAEGWNMTFMFTEKRRLMLFWAREAVIVVLGR